MRALPGPYKAQLHADPFPSFYNSIWLILNDVIVGIAFGAFMCEHHELIADFIYKHSKVANQPENSRLLLIFGHTIQFLTVNLMKTSLLWLDNWPAGLKLNTELSTFYCLVFTGLMDVWGRKWLPFITAFGVNWQVWIVVLDCVAPHLPTAVYTIGATGPVGMTMILSLLSDLLSLVTAHLYLSYLMVTAIFRHQLSMAASLFNLFRGKFQLF